MNLACLPSNCNLSVFHSVLKHCIDCKNPTSSIALFRQLLSCNVKPNDLTFSLLMKASASSPSSSAGALNSLSAKFEANLIQTHLLKSGVDQFVYVSTALLDLYMKLGCTNSARHLFDEMINRDVVSWNALICGYTRNGYALDALELFVRMVREGVSPNQRTLVCLIPSCGRFELLSKGKSVHGFGLKTGIGLDPQVKNVLTLMYAKCMDLVAAELLFEDMVDRSVVSWNTMIGAYGQNGLFDDAMLVFKQMLGENGDANSVTMVTLLSANADLESIHCYATKTGFVNTDSVVTSLICVYARHGKTESAELLYQSLLPKNLISLTAIISSYAMEGNMGLIMEYFARMQVLDIKLDAVAMVSIIQGITNPAHIGLGLAFHGYGFKSGLCVDHLVANGLITMYSIFNEIEAVFTLFLEMHEKPLISWNSVLSACVHTGRADHAIELFCQMKTFGQCPDSITIASLLSACSELGYTQFGQRLQGYVLRNNLDKEDCVETALVDMYTKCGSIERAEKIFKSIKEPCLATWNTMISGYSLYGFEHKALFCYSQMREQGLKPDKITFLGVLAACTHGGLIDPGRRYFKIMRDDFGIVPTLQHYACMVGLLGRAGLFEEALTLIKNMEVEPDSSVWGALLNACCIHQELRLGECLATRLFFLDCRSGGLLVLMSNLYAAKGRWDDVARVRQMMRDIGGDGCTGISLIEVT